MRWEGFAEKEGFSLQEWKTERVMDDDSGESTEEEVSFTGTGELESEKLVWGWHEEKPRVDSSMFVVERSTLSTLPKC